MKAKVRRIHSPDIDPTLQHVENPKDFGVLLQLLVGPAAGPGEESFDVMVCTPTWIERLVAKQGPLLGRHYLIVPQYDWSLIEEFLRRQIETVEEDDWQAIAQKIGRIGKWEFEDYSE